MQSHLFQKMDAPIEIFFLARKFQNDHPFTAWIDSCFENIENQIMFLRQHIHNRLLDNFRSVANNDFFRVHDVPF